MSLPTLQDFGLNGRAALVRVIEQSEYRSLPQAVASLTLFSHPDTVAQTQRRNVFRSVRRRQQRDVGTFAEVEGCGGRVLLDDNRSPAVALEWAHGIRERPDVQVNHIWSRSQDVAAYTALCNLCMTPAFLAKLTDTDPGITALLRYRAFDLYGYWPAEGAPAKPGGYDAVSWAETLAPVAGVEQVYRRAMRSKPKDRVVVCARELGWLFSGFAPDSAL